MEATESLRTLQETIGGQAFEGTWTLDEANKSLRTLGEAIQGRMMA